MSVSPDEINTLLETQTYNPNILPQLESYLHSQVSGNAGPHPYNFNANRTLVKLYQFFPHLAKDENLILVELLALVYGNDAQDGSVNFGALGCLISEATKRNEPFPALLRCAELFDSCQFTEFWESYAAIAESDSVTSYPKVKELAQSTHAETSLRRSILNNLSLAFKSASTETVMTQLSVKSVKDLEKFVKDHTDGIVEAVENDQVIFVSKSDNTKRDKSFKDEGRVDYGMIRNLGLIPSTE